MRLVLLPLAMVLCGSSALAENDYCPLQVGDEWTYKIAHIDAKGSIIKSVDHHRIRGTVEKDGKTYFRFETWGRDPAKKQDSSYVRKDEKGAYSTDDREKEGVENLWLSFPLKTGVSWQYDLGTDGATCTVIGFGRVTIGATTYKNCCHILVKGSDGKFARNMWVASGFGLVKSESVFAGGGKRTETLVKFRPANQGAEVRHD